MEEVEIALVFADAEWQEVEGVEVWIAMAEVGKTIESRGMSWVALLLSSSATVVASSRPSAGSAT